MEIFRYGMLIGSSKYELKVTVSDGQDFNVEIFNDSCVRELVYSKKFFDNNNKEWGTFGSVNHSYCFNFNILKKSYSVYVLFFEFNLSFKVRLYRNFKCNYMVPLIKNEENNLDVAGFVEQFRWK